MAIQEIPANELLSDSNPKINQNFSELHTRTSTVEERFDSEGILLPESVPALGRVQPTEVASEAAMLALVAESGDVAVRTDFTPPQAFMLGGSADPSVLSNWVPISFAVTPEGSGGLTQAQADARYPRILGDPSDGQHFAWSEADGMLVPVAAPSGGSGGASYRVFNIANGSDIRTPSSDSYYGASFTPTVGGLSVLGAVIRNTTAGATYTLYLRRPDTPATIIAQKASSGSGGPVRVVFDSPPQLASGIAYEIGYSSSAQANMRYTIGGFGVSGPDMLWANSFVRTTDSSGTSSRVVNTQYAPNMRLDYMESA